jgi:hypothetical protein
MSIITAFFASKIAVGLAAASLVTVGGTVAVTTAIGDAPATETTSQSETSNPAGPTTGAANSMSSDDSTTDSTGVLGDGNANRQGSDNSALGLCKAFINGNLSTNSVSYTSLENFASVSGTVSVNANGSVDTTAYCNTVIEAKEAATERAASAAQSETTTDMNLDVTTTP